MEKSDFKVLVRRVPGYEPQVSVRFEMSEGYGELHVGERRKASPSAAGEVAEVSGEAVRGGRFVHVLASGRRRQSYAFSRLDDDRLQRIPDDHWTELTPVTEFGIRYLELPAIEVATTAVVQMTANPAAERPTTPTPSADSSLLARARSQARATASVSPGAATLQTRAGSASPAPPRGASANVTRRTTASPATARTHTGPPTPDNGSGRAPTLRTSTSSVRPAPPRAHTSPPAGEVRGITVEAGLGRAAVARLSTEELQARLLQEMAKVEAMHEALADSEARLARSLAREADLVAVIAAWSERG